VLLRIYEIVADGGIEPHARGGCHNCLRSLQTEWRVLLRRIVNNGESRVNDPRFIFPRDGLGRVALFVASAFWGPVFGFVAYAFLLVASPCSAEGWLITTIVGKLGLAGMLFFSAGFVWSLFMPGWLESLVVRFTRTFILWLGLFVLVSLPYALWACFRA
jgi:hypothetical protein